MPTKGIFTISIDVELAWGMFDRGRHLKLKCAYEKSRPIIKQLLNLFTKYDIPITWAVVGHLFLESCRRRDNGIVHPDIVRPRHGWFLKDWFEYDPATNIHSDNSWYGRDIINLIKKATPEHEIASHSFSHIIFSDSGCSQEAAESDIAKCVRLAEQDGIKLDSFVFPRNAVGHLGILSKYGFRTYRSSDVVIDRINGRLLFGRRLFDLIKDMLPISPSVSDLALDKKHNLIMVPQSMLFRYDHGTSRAVLPKVRFLKAKKGLSKAVREKKIFHLWFHPINFAWNTERLFVEFEDILKFASNLKEKGELDILPLKDIAERAVSQNVNSDKFNLQSIDLHDERAHCFKDDYSSDLDDYKSSAFKFGRKKILDDLNKVFENFKKKSYILDLGCGTGYFLNLLSRCGFNVVGVDLSKQMLSELKKTNSKACVQMADARKLPFRDNSFDALLSIEVIRYFKDRTALLNEIYRVLKPGGIAFITAAPLFSTNFYGIFNSLCQLFRLRKLVSCYQSFETTANFKMRLERVGFKDIVINGHFFGPYFILDKISPSLSHKLISLFEPLDDKLSRIKILSNFANHLVAIMKKS